MLSRATSSPAPISAVICSWLEVAGPRVQTIFARRLIVNPLPVVYTTLAHTGPLVTGVTKRSPHGGRMSPDEAVSPGPGRFWRARGASPWRPGVTTPLCQGAHG